MIAINNSKADTQADTNLMFLSGTLNDFEVREAKSVLAAVVSHSSNQRLQIDVSELQTVSSVAVSFLLSGLRVAETVSCDLCYVNLPELLFNTARVGGVEAILTNFD